MIDFTDVSGDESYSGGQLLIEYAERATAPEAAFIAQCILSCDGKPLHMASTVIGLLAIFEDDIEGGKKALGEMLEGFRGALRSDVSRYKGAST